MFKHLPMAHHMIAQVHAHEPGELHEPWIDLPPRAGIVEGHGCNDVLSEPANWPLLCELINHGWAFSRVDRPAHHRERAGAIEDFSPPT